MLLHHLYSTKLNRFYIGSCQEDLKGRIQKHNDHSYGKHRYTAAASDWELYLTIECTFYSMVRNIELHIKRMESSTYIKNLKKYPELQEKLKSKYNNA